MLESIKMKDFMSIGPVTFQPDTEIFDAVHVLLKHKISGATVVDDAGHVVGVISEMDLLKAMKEISYYNQGDAQVGDYMTKELDSIENETNIFDAANTLLKLKRRRLPVVEQGRFSGQISCRSLLQAFKDSMSEHDKSEDNSKE